MVYARTIYRTGSMLIMVLLALLFTACASNGPSPNTPVVRATATPTATPGLAFQQFTNAGFTLKYPETWQTSQSSAVTGSTVYSFADASNGGASFHVELNAIYFDADSPIRDLFGTQMDNGTNCKPGDTSLAPTVIVNGVTWYQGDMICRVSGTAYEIHVYSHTDSTNHGPFIAYGAYQTSASALSFADLSKEIFEPMFQSFQLK